MRRTLVKHFDCWDLLNPLQSLSYTRGNMSFQSFNLLSEILQAVTEKGYTEPTSIQSQAIPLVLEGFDLFAGSQTGTGKTAGFTLPLLQNIMKGYKKRGTSVVKALVLTPTRELAAQVEESIKTYGAYLPLKSAVVFGGVNINPQIDKLQKGVDIVVATPGRLIDLMEQDAVDLSHIEILVLDEADRMLDMGFIHSIRKILKVLPKQRQNLLFSATFSPEIKKLASSFLTDPKTIQVAKSNSTAEGVSQTIYPVDSKNKRKLLSFLIRHHKMAQVLVFSRTKHGANRISKELEEEGIKAAAIHGNKSQGARTKALDDFKRGSVKVLVATDIAARGLDIDQLPYVINFDLPNVPEDYVHRIGRTGRAGNEGMAFSLVCIDEHKLLEDIEKLLKAKIEKVLIPGFEPDPSIKAVPIVNGRGGGGGGGRGPRGASPRGGSQNRPPQKRSRSPFKSRRG
jgi:ATP-dependent RNA helicase RhlE